MLAPHLHLQAPLLSLPVAVAGVLLLPGGGGWRRLTRPLLGGTVKIEGLPVGSFSDEEMCVPLPPVGVALVATGREQVEEQEEAEDKETEEGNEGVIR